MASSRRLTSQRIAQVINIQPNHLPEAGFFVAQNGIGARIAPVQPDSICIVEEDERTSSNEDVMCPEDDEMMQEGFITASEDGVADELQQHDRACIASRQAPGHSSLYVEPPHVARDFLGRSAAQAPLPTRCTTAFPLARRARTSWPLVYSDGMTIRRNSAPTASVSSCSRNVVPGSRQAGGCFLPDREATWFEVLEGDHMVLGQREDEHGILYSRDEFAQFADAEIMEEEPHVAQVWTMLPSSPPHRRFAEATEEDLFAEQEQGPTEPKRDHFIFCQPIVHKSPRSSASSDATGSTAETLPQSLTERFLLAGNETLNPEVPWRETFPHTLVRIERIEVANDFPTEEDTLLNEHDIAQILGVPPGTLSQEAMAHCFEWNSAVKCEGIQQPIFTPRELQYIVDIDSLKDTLEDIDDHWQPLQSEVVLQVYALSERTRRIGLPIFHLGVEVYAEEHFFTVGGVDRCAPCQYSWQVHSQSVPLGKTKLAHKDVEKVIEDMRKDWLPNEYAFLGRNCQDFAVAFCQILGVVDAIPFQCVRFANMSAVLPPLVISGLREADRTVASFVAMIGDGGVRAVGVEKVPVPNYPSRLGVLRNNEELPQVVLPLETEATVDL